MVNRLFRILALLVAVTASAQEGFAQKNDHKLVSTSLPFSKLEEIHEWNLPAIYVTEGSAISKENEYTLTRLRTILETRHDVMVVLVDYFNAGKGPLPDDFKRAAVRNTDQVRTWLIAKNKLLAAQIHELSLNADALPQDASELSDPLIKRRVEFRFIPLNLPTEERDALINKMFTSSLKK